MSLCLFGNNSGDLFASSYDDLIGSNHGDVFALNLFGSNSDDLFDEDYTAPSSSRHSDDFRDDFCDDEYSMERTSTTTTEKIRRARKARSGNRIDLGPYKDEDNKVGGVVWWTAVELAVSYHLVVGNSTR